MTIRQTMFSIDHPLQRLSKYFVTWGTFNGPYVPLFAVKMRQSLDCMQRYAFLGNHSMGIQCRGQRITRALSVVAVTWLRYWGRHFNLLPTSSRIVNKRRERSEAADRWRRSSASGLWRVECRIWCAASDGRSSPSSRWTRRRSALHGYNMQ